MDNIEISSEDLNELRQINPLAVAQLHNIALARKLKEKDEQLNILTKKVAPEKPDETPIEFTGRLADMRKKGMSKDKWWLADDKLLEANRSKIEGFNT
jgi:hypothetical protein